MVKCIPFSTAKRIYKGVQKNITTGSGLNSFRHAKLQAIKKSKLLRFVKFYCADVVTKILFVVRLNTNQAKQGKRVYIF